jgi:hypothetical protein
MFWRSFRQWDLNYLEVPRLRPVDRFRNAGCVATNDFPDVRAENYQSELSVNQILLIADVLIGCDEHIERSRLCRAKKLTVLDPWRPIHFEDCANFVPGKKGAQASRDIVIEQDAQCDDR